MPEKPPIGMEKESLYLVLVIRKKKRKQGGVLILLYQVQPIQNKSITLKYNNNSTMLRKILFRRKQLASHLWEVSRNTQRKFEHFPSPFLGDVYMNTHTHTHILRGLF